LKKIGLTLLVLVCFFVTGCGKTTDTDILKEMDKKVDDGKGYVMTASLEVLNNDDIYNYQVETAYRKDDYYKITLTNTANNHQQIILKNEDGVYVLTPSLNKSFKFQSDWPYNNSQIYLLQSIISDLDNDDKRTFKNEDKSYVFTSSVNYPNNRNLVKQKVTFNDKLELNEVIVLDSDDVPNMILKVKDIDFNPSFKNNYFDLEEIMSTFNLKEEVIGTGAIDNTIYPLVLPDGTKLANEEKVDMMDGERVILTFSGDKPFLLVEETVKAMDEFTVIPTIGEPVMFMDSLGVLSDNYVSFTSGGINYYLVSDVMNQDELLEVANSINVLPTVK
jgi:sporulation protein ydcC